MKKLKIPNNYKNYLVVLFLIAIISGSLFYFKLDRNNQDLIKIYMESYFQVGEPNSLFSLILFNLFIFILIWLLGLSMFGSIIVLFIYFVKVFLLTISVSAILNLEASYKLVKAFLYVFPSQIAAIFVYSLITIYAINFSFLFYKILFKKTELNFKNLFLNYTKIFAILFIILILVIIYQVCLNPLIFRLVFK